MLRRRTITAVLLAAPLAASLLAFSGSFAHRAIAAADPLDACALLTRADVADIVGEEPGNPKPAETTPQLPGSEMVGSTCQYKGEGWRLRFFVERGHTESSKKVARMAFKGWKPVGGLGDEAWWGQS